MDSDSNVPRKPLKWFGGSIALNPNLKVGENEMKDFCGKLVKGQKPKTQDHVQTKFIGVGFFASLV
jgi:hypothetical protein